MKLNDSIIICYISVRVPCTTKANMKKLSRDTIVPAYGYVVIELNTENNKRITCQI